LSSGARLTKLYYRIGEAAEIVGVEPHVLRYWETEFRSVRPQKSAKGQRVYTRGHIETLLKVKDLLYSHRFTIAGARTKLRQGGLEPLGSKEQSSNEEVERLRQVLLTIREDLVAMMDELERA
jgi:DNA-binding transcriptional MerR regulator